MRRELGKIDRAVFGIGGYQDACIGLSLSFSMRGGGVGEFMGTWNQSVEVSDRTKWTEDDRSKHHADVVRFIDKILHEARVNSVDELVGIPVELTFDGMRLDSWRVLTEVL